MIKGVFGNDDWYVQSMPASNDGVEWYGVMAQSSRDVLDHLDACRKCVQQAIDGNPDAVAAILLCVDDTQLQNEVKRMMK